MKLRKGKTKTILECSIESALLAVEIYNKPRAPFRVENYISLMVMAWTRLFHAYFYQNNGDKFYYKKKGSTRYEIVDGEKKAWELKTCIRKYNKLDEDVKKNLEFFIKLRNKIEHRSITKDDVGTMIFGECQSLLYNFETFLIKIFGEEYSLNESLAYSLQFSKLRTSEQEKANKKALSKDIIEIKKFIEKYRANLSEEVFNSQNYSIKLIQIPKIKNNDKSSVPAIEFVNWDKLSEEDKAKFDKVSALIKDKVVKTEVINPGKLKPGIVIKKIEERKGIKLNHFNLKCLYFIFSIRPISEEEQDEFKTNTNYCHYDEVHGDYIFRYEFVDFICKLLDNKNFMISDWKVKFDKKEKLNIDDYE